MKNKENIVINKIQAAENVTDNTSKKLKKEKQHSAGRLQRVSLTEKRFLDDAVHLACPAFFQTSPYGCFVLFAGLQ